MEDEDSAKGTAFAANLKLWVPNLKSETEIVEFESNGELVAILQPSARSVNSKAADTICLNFFSTAKEIWKNGRVTVKRTIKKARYWDANEIRRVPQFEASLKKFEEKLKRAELIEEYVFRTGQTKDLEKVSLSSLIGSDRRSGRHHRT